MSNKAGPEGSMVKCTIREIDSKESLIDSYYGGVEW